MIIIQKHLKTSGILWQYCKDKQAVDANDAIIDFNAANVTTNAFNCKEKNKSSNKRNGRKNVEIMVSLKYLSNFWKTFDIPLINLNWSQYWTVVAVFVADKGPTFSITDTTLYDSVVTLSTLDNAELLGQLKPILKITINWNKCLSKVSIERLNQ